MYDYNLTEYDILKMNDDEYLKYCKLNKKYSIITVVLFLICESIFALFAIYEFINQDFICAVPAFLCGFCSAYASFNGIELKRWNLEIERFKKECTSYDSDIS